MDGLNFNALYNKIYSKLIDTPYNKLFIQRELKSNNFKYKLGYMLKEKDFSCDKTLDLCIDILNELSGNERPDNWMFYIFQYTLNKSFPEATTIDLKESLNFTCEFYLKLLRIICDSQKQSEDNTWQSIYPLNFLNEEEENSLEHPEEYRKFVRAFKKNYTYEMMKLSDEVQGYNTLDHICGVHYLAIHIGRQISHTEIPVDLGRISGAAAGHDLGKYGCKKSESKRVPYLHYYYSDQWFKKHKMDYIRNIALNHSTWDLELENLSLESLILIYSDFRVKNKLENGKYTMNIFSLKEAYDVILSKLDNVDKKKERRYSKVFAKLMDFENFLLSMNINVNLDYENKEFISYSPNYSLLQGKETIENIKFLSIYHNIGLMNKLRDEISLDKIIQEALSEKNWKNLREYIKIFEEYSTYLTQRQKLQAIKFLFENLVHSEEDIRKHCSELIGSLIATYDEEYRKEVPEEEKIKATSYESIKLFEKYFKLMLYPSNSIIPSHRSWLGYACVNMVKSTFKNCKDHMINLYIDILHKYYNTDSKSQEIHLYLIDMLKYIPIIDNKLFQYVLFNLNKRHYILRLTSLETMIYISSKLPPMSVEHYELKNYIQNTSTHKFSIQEKMLRLKLINVLVSKNVPINIKEHLHLTSSKVSDILLNNLKSATHWVIKKYDIELLINSSNKLHAAIHFCNLLKVSEMEIVRNSAGSALLKIMPYLSSAERNEVSIELIRAIEIQEHKFTEYIPRFLGEIILFLPSKELDEIIEDFELKIKYSNLIIKSLILKTVSITIANYTKHFPNFDDRFKKLIGILLNGLGDYNDLVKQSAIGYFGKEIFASPFLSLLQKEVIFKMTAKKILTLISEDKDDLLLFLANSAGLNHIYKFISNFTYEYGDIHIPIYEKVAFFPGTFDPFSITHKEIARRIRNMGYEIYFAIDEFSWSKRTLPHTIRKNILNMSISSELNMYIYPDNFPTNLNNDENIKVLKLNYPNSKVYIVAGSDVILNASAYKKQHYENSIHYMPHIIFQRGKVKVQTVKNILKGETILLTLPNKYTNVSSTQIRNYIDSNRDISSLVDPLVQQYIYENGFYQREPEDKSYMKFLSLDIQAISTLTPNLLCELSHYIPDITNYITENTSFVILRDESKSNKILALSIFHPLTSKNFYEELEDSSLCKYLRKNIFGKTMYIDGFFIFSNHYNKNIDQIIITETLAFSVKQDCEFAIYRPKYYKLYSPAIAQQLKLQGFQEISGDTEVKTLIVNMSMPCILNLDIENALKEPFRSNLKIKSVIESTRKKLKEALTKLYPGQLVLCFDSNVLYEQMIKKICKENNISSIKKDTKSLGPYMCVSYGDILDKYIIPNTVTKTLHTEKYMNPNMKSFRIKQFPYHMSLENQMKMLKAFNRPILLADNLLHKGYRMKALNILFKKENIYVKKIIAGILSGRGKDLMDSENREVEHVYYIPKLRLWFDENSLYPFIGGDTLWRGKFSGRNLIPSINMILPYTFPNFIKVTDKKVIYNLSKVCILNSIEILNCIEHEYHSLYEENLNLFSLGKVFAVPRYPDAGENISYDLNLSPSFYLKNHLELLDRYSNLF